MTSRPIRRLAPLLTGLTLFGPGLPAAGQAPVQPRQAVGYHLEPTRDPTGRDARDDAVRWSILEKLNRADRDHLPTLDFLVVPDRWLDDELVYTPFPIRYEPGVPHPTLLIVHLTAQAFAGYEHGRLVRWGPISSGRAARPTPTGVFFLNWRSPGRRSTLNADWFMPWYFNFQNTRGLSFHQHPLPGYPASHACVRLLERDAIWLFQWGESWTLDDRGQEVLRRGTPVVIVGRHDPSAPPVWRSLDWLTEGITDLPLLDLER